VLGPVGLRTGDGWTGVGAAKLRSLLAVLLADVPPGPLVSAEVSRLEELRLAAIELRIEASIADGSGSELVAELHRLTDSYPLRERFWQLLMRALDASGRPAEALAAYARAREVIADELGADPGPDLQRLHLRLLARENTVGAAAVAPPAAGQPEAASGQSRPAAESDYGPRELPGAVADFVGRTEELGRLFELLDQAALAGAGGAVVISAIGGTAGVGKTALALHWAHQAADRFPDGQLYVNLRGYDRDQPMTAGDALAGFLRTLGVAGSDIPADTGERATLYRSMLAGRRVLLILDNAAQDAQVRPLLPGAPGSMAVVTSRGTLAGLVARDGAHRLDLDLLPTADAVGLMRTLVGERAQVNPAAARTLVAQCARLPLALRVAADWAGPRPGSPLDELTAELADQQRRLDLLDATGDPMTAVRAVSSWSYQHLDEPAARMFRLLGVHPGPDISAAAAASLAGLPPRRRRPCSTRWSGYIWSAGMLPAGSPSTTCCGPTRTSRPRRSTARPGGTRRRGACSTTTCAPATPPINCSSRAATGHRCHRLSPATAPGASPTRHRRWTGSTPSVRCCGRSSGWPRAPASTRTHG
jgi:hypothetical protein